VPPQSLYEFIRGKLSAAVPAHNPAPEIEDPTGMWSTARGEDRHNRDEHARRSAR